MYNGLQAVAVKGTGLSGYVERSRVQLAPQRRRWNPSITSSGVGVGGENGEGGGSSGGGGLQNSAGGGDESVNPLAVQRSYRENADAARRLARHKAIRGVHLRIWEYRQNRLQAGMAAGVVDREASELYAALMAAVEEAEAESAAVERKKSAAAFAAAFDVRAEGHTWDPVQLQREKQLAEEEWRERKEREVGEKLKRMRTEGGGGEDE